jgi:hypothetical protein
MTGLKHEREGRGKEKLRKRKNLPRTLALVLSKESSLSLSSMWCRI